LLGRGLGHDWRGLGHDWRGLGHDWRGLGHEEAGGLGGEEVRGPTSWAVSVDETGTASVEAVKAPPVPGVQKPPRRVGKRFRDRRVAAPMKRKVKRPAGLRTRPAWLRQDRLGASPAVCHGDAGCQLWPCQP
jgi:hypothetical protein